MRVCVRERERQREREREAGERVREREGERKGKNGKNQLEELPIGGIEIEAKNRVA